VFENDFRLFSEPEIMRRPIDDLLLQMKAMNIDRVVNFPFPTSPDKEAMEAAEKRLVILGSLSVEDTTGGGQVSRITPLGMTMAQLPVAPHFAKMLCLSRQHGCLPYMIAIVAGLSVKELFAESDISFLTTEVSVSIGMCVYTK
jgi:ATP-dependent RNA helicase DHX37/DHR1